MKVNIRTIDNSKHRYPTLGDYFKKDKDILYINISELGNPKFELLIALHEFIEWFLTESKGIHEHDILKFDEQFEKDRNKGIHHEDAEPGDHKNSPYRKEHRFAENIERMVAHELGIDFNEYNQYLMDFINGKLNKPKEIDPKLGK